MQAARRPGDEAGSLHGEHALVRKEHVELGGGDIPGLEAGLTIPGPVTDSADPLPWALSLSSPGLSWPPSALQASGQ